MFDEKIEGLQNIQRVKNRVEKKYLEWKVRYEYWCQRLKDEEEFVSLKKDM